MDTELSLALFWSAKAGCTYAVKWMLFQLDLLDEAYAFSHWPHDYREHVFYERRRHTEALLPLLSGDLHVVKVVRNPFIRCVSSYNHALSSPFVPKDLINEEGFSFEQFVSYLETQDLSTGNIHWRRQTHPLEEAGIVGIDTVIKLEYVQQQLKDLEKRLSLKESPSSLSRTSHVIPRISATGYVGKVIFSRNQQTYPQYRSFYNEDLLARVSHLYAQDFIRYDYPFHFL